MQVPDKALRREINQLQRQVAHAEKSKAATERRLQELRQAIKESSQPAEVCGSMKQAYDLIIQACNVVSALKSLPVEIARH
jgi:iron-sulfur cluster repair protein YtfE (RIC family)